MSAADASQPSSSLGRPKADESFARLPYRLSDDVYFENLGAHGFWVVSMLTLLEQRNSEVRLTLEELKAHLGWTTGDSHLSKTLLKLRTDGWIEYQAVGQSRRVYRFRLTRARVKVKDDSDWSRTGLGFERPLESETTWDRSKMPPLHRRW